MSNIETELSRLSKERKINYSLDNIKLFLEKIGNPHNSIKIIHVAGTNGKGTTSDFIAQYLEQMGFKVGVYSSPHLNSYCERYRINGTDISENILDSYYHKVRMMEGASNLTEFEILTVIAFCYFSDSKVDYLVLETGLGGRLDATNVVNSIAAVITTISYDHMDYLGDSIEAIAKEKAGIIKKNTPTYLLYSGSQSLSILKVVAKANGSSLNVFKSKSSNYLTKNRAFARYIVKGIFKNNTEKLSILKTYLKTRVKGRMHVLRTRPILLFDSAHNLEGIQALCKEIRNKQQKINIIFAATRRPNIKDIIKEIQAVAIKLYLCEFDNPRAYSIEEYRELNLDGSIEYVKKEDLKIIIDKAKNEKSEDYCITGSIYFLGEVYLLTGPSTLKVSFPRPDWE